MHFSRRQIIAGTAATAVVAAAPAAARQVVERQRVAEIRDRLKRAWRAQGALTQPDRVVITAAEFARLPVAAGLQGSYCAVIEQKRLEIRRVEIFSDTPLLLPGAGG